MIKIKMGIQSDAFGQIKSRKTSLILDCTMDEFDHAIHENFTKKGIKTVGIYRSKESRVFKIFNNKIEFVIEAKEVSKLTIDTTMDIIKNKIGYKEAKQCSA